MVSVTLLSVLSLLDIVSGLARLLMEKKRFLLDNLLEQELTLVCRPQERVGMLTTCFFAG